MAAIVNLANERVLRRPVAVNRATWQALDAVDDLTAVAQVAAERVAAAGLEQAPDIAAVLRLVVTVRETMHGGLKPAA